MDAKERIDSKLDSEMCNHEVDSIKNNKRNKNDKTNNKVVFGSPLNILGTCNFKCQELPYSNIDHSTNTSFLPCKISSFVIKYALPIHFLLLYN